MASSKTCVCLATLLWSYSCVLSAHTSPWFPWCEYEAEDAVTNAAIVEPSRNYRTFQSEARGRSYVELSEQGDYVEFTVTEPADGMVLRYSIPDAERGGGIDATLSASLNGELLPKLELTSRYVWSYGHFPWTNDPWGGMAHHFYDEIRVKLPMMNAGDRLRLEISEGDEADFYLIDFIELELIPKPLEQPEGSLSLEVFKDASPATDGNRYNCFVNAVEAARSQGRVLWLPPCEIFLDGPRIELGGVTIQGAGMWHTKLHGMGAMFEGTGDTLIIRDLSIFGEIAHRDDMSPDNAFNGNFGRDSRFERLWIEHVKCAFWTLNGTDGMVLSESRVRNVMADGLNFCDGTRNSTVKNSHFRNTGDDALASWSPSGDWSSKQICRNNRFIGNRIEQPWHANGIGFYGGADHSAIDNEIRETVMSGAGVLVSSGFGAIPFQGTIRVEGNRIYGAGGPCYIGEPVGGIWLHAKDSDVKAEVILRNNYVEDARSAGISIHGNNAWHSLVVDGLTLVGDRAESAVHIFPASKGVMELSNLETPQPEETLILNQAGDAFQIERN